jgi:signal transduction histidine kinase/ActR/RegA family two-component response regulator
VSFSLSSPSDDDAADLPPARLLHAMVESVADALFALDRRGCFVFLNGAAERRLGRLRADLLGRPIWLEFPEAVGTPFEREIQRAFAENVAVEFEGCLPAGPSPVRVRAHPIDAGLAVSVGEIASADDKDRRVLNDARLFEAQRLESVGTLAAGMAHELNNALVPVVMGAGLLKRAELPADLLPVVTNMEQSASRGAALLKQVLAFARGAPGTRVPVALADLFAQVCAVVKATFPRDIAVDCAVSAELPAIPGDPTQLKQVFLNLCVNARDAMPRGGRLRVTSRVRSLSPDEMNRYPGASPGRYVEIEIADSGPGMPPDVKRRAFEPFFTTKAVGKGTGLGLPVALGIVRGHGGDVEIVTREGAGTVVRVLLPVEVRPQTVPEATAEAGAELQGGGARVLVVDDDPAVLSVVRRALGMRGFQVLAADNGTEAVAVFARWRREVAVVLTDLAMPGMDGADLIGALRAIEPGVRIVAFSGLDDPDTAGRLDRLGVSHFLAKPPRIDAMVSILAEALARPAGDPGPPQSP